MNTVVLMQTGIVKFQQDLEVCSETLSSLLQKVWVALDGGVSDDDIDTVVAIQSQTSTLKDLLSEIERVFPFDVSTLERQNVETSKR